MPSGQLDLLVTLNIGQRNKHVIILVSIDRACLMAVDAHILAQMVDARQ